MPQYLYRCPWCETKKYIRKAVNDSGAVHCEECDNVMQKRPIAVAVNWNGNKPSEGGVTDLVHNMIADAPRQRDEIAAKKELSDGS